MASADEFRAARVAERGFCSHCGEPFTADPHACQRERLAGTPFDPARYCTDCGTKLTVQVLPQGVDAVCLRCTRRVLRAQRTRRSLA